MKSVIARPLAGWWGRSSACRARLRAYSFSPSHARGSHQSHDRKGVFALRHPASLAVTALAFAVTAHAQMGRMQDWSTFAGDPGRSGFERSDSRITKESVAKEFALLYKTKLDANARGQQ